MVEVILYNVISEVLKHNIQIWKNFKTTPILTAKKKKTEEKVYHNSDVGQN